MARHDAGARVLALRRWRTPAAQRALGHVGPFALLGLVLLYYAGYVKDDAYISFRYGAQWVRGNGLVFNIGEHVEGYTNFLWTIAVALLTRLGVPALLGAKLLGAVAALAGLVSVRRLAEGSDPPSVEAGNRAAWLYAASPTVGLWAASGMEPVALAAAAAVAALLAARAAAQRTWRAAIAAGAAMAICALLRPEGHLVALLLLVVVPRALPIVLLALVPYHLWRVVTYGDGLPNTFHIKGHADTLWSGLQYAGLFSLFYGHGLLLALALWVATRQRRLLAWIQAALVVLFLLYLVWVGDDEMRWFRLYAPALPFLFALAARALPRWALVAFVLFGVCAHGSAWHLRQYLEADHRAYFPLGDAIAARARPGDWALFQDVGATPYRALDVPFRDPIGLTDRGVSRLYRAAGWSPFRGPGPGDLEKRIRDELLGRDPRFIAFVAYVEGPRRREVRTRFAQDPETALRPFIAGNSYSHGIPVDPRFTARHRFVGAWRRNDGYYLVLYERR
jgi:hypothetical protein